MRTEAIISFLTSHSLYYCKTWHTTIKKASTFVVYRSVIRMNAAGFTLRRSDIVSALYIVGVINGLIPNVIASIEEHGFWAAASGTFGSSVLVVLATWIGANLVLQTGAKKIDAADSIALTCFVSLILFPDAIMSWFAVTFFALFERIRGATDPAACAAASLFAIIAVSEFWSPGVLRVFPHVVNLDAALSGWVLNVLRGGGVRVIGNVIFTDGQKNLVILAYCSSLLHLPYVVLCWATVRQATHPGWLKRDILGLLWVAGLVIILNTIRIALMGLSDDAFEIIHGVVGIAVFHALLLLVAFFVATRAAEPNSDRSPLVRRGLADRDGQL
jgi:hypothetical protein